jgi:hypothetical protein
MTFPDSNTQRARRFGKRNAIVDRHLPDPPGGRSIRIRPIRYFAAAGNAGNMPTSRASC